MDQIKMHPYESSLNYEENHDDGCLKSNNILNELKRNKSDRDLKTFRKLLAYPPKTCDDTWTPVLLKLLNIIGDNEEGHIDQMRLASQAFFTIFATSPSINRQEDYLTKILSLNSSPLYLFDDEIYIHDVELFKLIIIHGYILHINNETVRSFNNFTTAFDIIRKYCMTYTKHIYFAFKLLDIWLIKSKEIKFWKENDLEIEKKLEAIIFSNWDNCINEISTMNSSHVFPIYLEIMEDKYNGFLTYALETANKYLSWQSPTKFIIITEICKVSHYYPNVEHLESNLFQSITKCHLKHVGTKLYIALLGNMREEQWNELIRNHLFSWATKWESEKNEKALHILWELWMKPTVKKFKDITAINEGMKSDMFPHHDTNNVSFIQSLWYQFCDHGTMMSASYIAKIASEVGMTWTKLNSYSNLNRHTHQSHYDAKERYWSNCKVTIVPCIIDVSEEYVKLNVFAAYCRMGDFLNEYDHYELCRRFLYCNANSCSTQFRKLLLDNFKILFERVVKIRGDMEISFCQWLYYFIFDCIEPGSCYQRKIIGLRLYEIILMYTNGMVDEKRKKKRKNMPDGVIMKEYMRDEQKWDMDNKYSFLIMLRMCTDPIEEIRELSFVIINNYFNVNELIDSEIRAALKLKAREMNKSSKFYEIAGGVKLTLIVHKYEATLRYIELHKRLFDKARISLNSIKQDIFKAFTVGSEFIASLSALLEFEFQKASNNFYEKFFKQLLNLIEDATVVFLSALVPKASNISFSSSFSEMGIAIDERIKSSGVFHKFDKHDIPVAHQIVLSCIWMALKTLCDLTAKISILTNCYDTVKRSMDVIVSVLMKCRHKGAIEAAGVALGVLVRHITHNDKQEYYCLIDTCLDKLLSLNPDDKIDLTRRGAGLSIMFHKIVSNDNKKTRRFLHMAMGRLIGSLSVPAKKSDIVMDTNQDCVYARQLHFLRTIFVDKTLYPHLVPYIEKISMICFEHLQSLEWAIRNASLQLMGVLISRLVGQSPESELDFGNGYSVNHFFTHYSILAEFVLQRVNDPSAFNIDSNMVPIVTLISKMSVGGCDFTDYSSQKYTANLRNAIRLLFGHTVDHVRYAAAKAYAALVAIREIPRELLNMKTEKIENKSRNFIHGHLMAQICLYLSAERAGIWLDTFSTERYITRMLKQGNKIQLDRAWSMCDYWLNGVKKNGKVPLCYVIEATFLQCCRMTSFWRYTSRNISDCTFNKIHILLTKYNPMIKRAIGVSEFVDQLFQLYIDTRIGHMSHLTLYDDNCYAAYYSLKFVRDNILTYLLPIPCIKDTFEFIIEFLCKNVLNDHMIIEGLEIFFLVLTYLKDSLYFRSPKIDYLSELFKTVDPYKTLQLLLEQYSKRKKICLLIYKVLSLLMKMTNHDIPGKMLSPLDRQNFIKSSINNGDEQERISVMDLFSDYDIHAIKSLIALISDENQEVRMALYKIMSEKQRPDILYYLSSGYIHLHECRYCTHEMGMSLITKNMQILLHNLIRTFAARCPLLSLREYFKWMPHIVKDKTSYKNKLKSPFDEDETYREITKTFNIYDYYLNALNSTRPGPFRPHDYHGIIMSGHYFLLAYLTHSSDTGFIDLHMLFHFKVADYLHYKAEIYEKKYFPELEEIDSDYE